LVGKKEALGRTAEEYKRVLETTKGFPKLREDIERVMETETRDNQSEIVRIQGELMPEVERLKSPIEKQKEDLDIMMGKLVTILGQLNEKEKEFKDQVNDFKKRVSLVSHSPVSDEIKDLALETYNQELEQAEAMLKEISERKSKVRAKMLILKKDSDELDNKLRRLRIIGKTREERQKQETEDKKPARPVASTPKKPEPVAEADSDGTGDSEEGEDTGAVKAEAKTVPAPKSKIIYSDFPRNIRPGTIKYDEEGEKIGDIEAKEKEEERLAKEKEEIAKDALGDTGYNPFVDELVEIDQEQREKNEAMRDGEIIGSEIPQIAHDIRPELGWNGKLGEESDDGAGGEASSELIIPESRGTVRERLVVGRKTDVELARIARKQWEERKKNEAMRDGEIIGSEIPQIAHDIRPELGWNGKLGEGIDSGEQDANQAQIIDEDVRRRLIEGFKGFDKSRSEKKQKGEGAETVAQKTAEEIMRASMERDYARNEVADNYIEQDSKKRDLERKRKLVESLSLSGDTFAARIEKSDVKDIIGQSWRVRNDKGVMEDGWIILGTYKGPDKAKKGFVVAGKRDPETGDILQRSAHYSTFLLWSILKSEKTPASRRIDVVKPESAPVVTPEASADKAEETEDDNEVEFDPERLQENLMLMSGNLKIGLDEEVLGRAIKKLDLEKGFHYYKGSDLRNLLGLYCQEDGLDEVPSARFILEFEKKLKTYRLKSGVALEAAAKVDPNGDRAKKVAETALENLTAISSNSDGADQG
jgi:hypothetical protein